MTVQSTAQPAPSIIRALRAEVTKLHNSTAPVTVVVIPAIIAVVITILSVTSPYAVRPLNAWLDSMSQMITFWATLMPFIVALVTALLATVEHSNNMWKHIFALPISRGSIYAAKQIVAVALFGLSMAVLVAGVLVAGLLLRALKPGFGFEAPIPLAAMLNMAVISWLASWLIIALHQWVGVRSTSFGPAIGFGLVGFLLNTMIFTRTDWWPRVFPWSLPSNFFEIGLTRILMENPIKWDVVPLSVAIGVIGGVVVTILAAWDISRRDVDK
jgi:lantibiotic transport system permease protein